MSETLYGRNAVRECLRARRRHIHRLLLADNLKSSPILREITTSARKLKIPVSNIARKKLDDLGHGHQGVALEVGRYPFVSIDEILLRAQKAEQPPFILAFDHLEDPHNLGAILRTAEIVGVHGVLLPKQRSAKITSTVSNVSAGAAEHIWISQISSLAQALQQLKQENIWVAGVEYAPQAVAYHQANLSGPLVLVVGSEGQGMSRLVQQTCDFLVKLPMRGQIESLNASVASGILLYEIWRARGFASDS